MRAIQLKRFGGPDVLDVVEMPDLPVILGVEVSGTVEALGQGVDASLTGTRVAAPLFASKRPFGGYAEYVTIDAKLAVPLPDILSFEDATAL
ncbi:MAG: zinc-binding alcohol dehydrogenase family protein, partial [Mesorhizobium sp.]